MNPNCEQARIICRNKNCGFPSKKNPDVWLCKLCRIAEKSQEDSKFMEEDIQSRPSLTLEASVTYNKENNRFDYDANKFFEIVGEHDAQIKG